jgi:hypothetical protein
MQHNNLASYLKNMFAMKDSFHFTISEIEKLPANHAARKNPNLVVERQIVGQFDIPPLGTISNRAGVLFNDETVQHKTQ